MEELLKPKIFQDEKASYLSIATHCKSAKHAYRELVEFIYIYDYINMYIYIVKMSGVQLLMDELELPPDRATLFEAIDADGSGTLHLGELVQGLLKIRGDLNKSDTVAALLATKALQHMLLKTQMRVHEVFLAVQSLKSDLQWMGTGTCTPVDSEQRHSEKTSTEATGPPKSSLPEFPVPLLAADAREPPLVEEDVNDVDGLLYFLPTDLHSQE